MTIKALKPIPGMPEPPVVTPRCEATVQVPSESQVRWRTRNIPVEPFRCTHPAVVEVEGHHYCRLHGGHVVLDMYLKGQLVRVPEPEPS